MAQKTLGEYESTGLECPECDYSCNSYQALGPHWSKAHGGIPPWKRTECEYCGETFGRSQANSTQSDNEFCSRDCYHSWNKKTGALAGEDNPQYKEPLTVTCEWCDEDYSVPPVHSDSRFCSHGCKSEWLASRTGSDHPLYTGGTNLYRSVRSGLGPTGWHTLRQEHLDCECDMCGAETTGSGRGLSLHHIVPIMAGGTNGAFNFMTLCESCHSKAESYCSDLPGFDRILVE